MVSLGQLARHSCWSWELECMAPRLQLCPKHSTTIEERMFHLSGLTKKWQIKRCVNINISMCLHICRIFLKGRVIEELQCASLWGSNPLALPPLFPHPWGIFSFTFINNVKNGPASVLLSLFPNYWECGKHFISEGTKKHHIIYPLLPFGSMP